MKIKTLTLTVTSMSLALAAAVPAQAGSEKNIGEVFMTAANFCPRDTANLDGQLLRIAEYTPLFSLFGTTYGGDGRTSFGLPDMRGRSALHVGQGGGLHNYRQGSKGGAETQLVKPTQGKIETRGNGGLASSTAPVNVRGPYLTLRYCIVTVGMSPMRSK